MQVSRQIEVLGELPRSLVRSVTSRELSAIILGGKTLKIHGPRLAVLGAEDIHVGSLGSAAHEPRKPKVPYALSPQLAPIMQTIASCVRYFANLRRNK
jgi:hypothetical protein